MVLDHLFVFVEDGALAEKAALDAGLVPTHRRIHPGQGTENVCFRFGSVFLELLWVRDVDEIRSEAVARTGLWPRSQWRSVPACPFGVCLRGTPTFPSWTYSVPFPPGMSVEISTRSEQPDQALVFAISGPAGEPPPSVQPLGREISSVELAYPGADVPVLVDAGLRVRSAEVPRVTLTIDGGTRGERIDVDEALLTILR